MKHALLALAALSACVSAQVTYDNGTFTCSPGGGAYCAGGNIIIRCTGTVGQPGNCNDNLAGQPPLGVSYSPCVESSPTAGDAACSKNGIVYPGSGATEPVSSSSSSVIIKTTTTTTKTTIPSYSNSTAVTTTTVVVSPPVYTSITTSVAGSVSLPVVSLPVYTGPTTSVAGTVSLPVVSLPSVTPSSTVARSSTVAASMSKSASVSVPVYTGAASMVEGKRVLGGVAAIVLGALAL